MKVDFHSDGYFGPNPAAGRGDRADHQLKNRRKGQVQLYE